MTPFPFTTGPHGIAVLDEAARAYEHFKREGTPISQQQARHMAFAAFLVRSNRVNEFYGPAARPGRFVTNDPRKGWARS